MKVSGATSANKRDEASSSPSQPTARRYRLTGRSVRLDPETDAFRSDIADIGLAGRVIASHYAEPMLRVATRAVEVRRGIDEASPIACRLSEGDGFAVIDVSRSLAWGYCLDHHQVGYLPADALG